MSQSTTKRAKTERYIPCTKCFVNGRRCDSNTHACTHCVLRRQGDDCQRVKCKHFETGRCKNKKCKFAHKKDNCSRLVKHMKLKVIHAGGSSDQDSDYVEERTLENIGGTGETYDNGNDSDGISGVEI